ncbi:superoxide dismutase family protein [Polynucleobacter sp. es-MAR-4]|uniref:superoxide dismutase family protein n=1 Tax=Polynucleobacter sp. es-MAR-4 TaxID=1855655 RepID=UPI001C0D9BC3|nr:superoxide dismutase family protein [Polynucleobacter sp. es-MAR-4]MBU3636082.1 superoxide dismutase family protein [Polynucleobacter sp. es-MAR-4]
MIKIKPHYILIANLLLASLSAHAEVRISISKISANGVGEYIGTISAIDTPKGLLLTPNLKDLPAGDHGFHIHQNPSCESLKKDGISIAGLAAGGHFDPGNTGKHEGYMGHGHKGDMPVLTVNPNGTADKALIVPHLKEVDILGRSIMIHAGGDNYSDTPLPLGGGGARIACGVIKQVEVSEGGQGSADNEVGTLLTVFQNLANSF